MICLTLFFSPILTLTKSAFFNLWRIVQLHPFISVKDAETLITSSHLGYCNSLFTGLPVTSIAILQYIQNSAARILTRTKCSAHITPILADLHWLTVAYRIKCKILQLNFKAFFVVFVICSFPILHLVHYGLLSLAFSLSLGIASLSWGADHSAVLLWNYGNLPRSLGLVNNPSEFKSQLKTSQNVTFVKLTSVSSVLSTYYSPGVRFYSCICLMLSSVLLFDVIITYWMFIVKCPWALERRYINKMYYCYNLVHLKYFNLKIIE